MNPTIPPECPRSRRPVPAIHLTPYPNSSRESGSSATGVVIRSNDVPDTTPAPPASRSRAYAVSSSAVAQIVPSAVALSNQGHGAHPCRGSQGRSENGDA